jgi:hypothetical protein
LELNFDQFTNNFPCFFERKTFNILYKKKMLNDNIYTKLKRSTPNYIIIYTPNCFSYSLKHWNFYRFFFFFY